MTEPLSEYHQFDSMVGKIPDPSQSVPEHAPTVVFDVNLGKEYEYVDFDYDAFADQATQLGLSNEAAQDLTITVSAGVSKQDRGYYDDDEYAITLRARNYRDDTLTHELQHAADSKNGYPRNNFRKKVGNAAVRPLRLCFPVSCGAVVVRAVGGQTGEIIANFSLVSALTIGATALWGHLLHPLERRARKAEKTPYPSVLSFKPIDS